MAQPARRRRTHPSLPPVPPEPPDPPEPPPAAEAQAEAAPGEEVVQCFLSGVRVPKSQAVRVRLGPGKVMWMAKELTNQG